MQSRIKFRELNYMELGLLVIIIGLIVIFLLDRVRGIHKQAERQLVIGQINTMRGKVMATLNREFSINFSGTETIRNPVRLMKEAPENYMGEISHPEQMDIPPGSWYFNTQNGFLIYKAKYEHEFPFTREAVTNIRLALMTLDQAEKIKTGNILTCGPKLCLTRVNIQ